MNAVFNLLRCCFAAATIVAYVLPSTSFGAIVTYNFSLSGAAEAPVPNNSPGTGSGQVFVDTAAHTLRIVANFSGLTGTTTAAHIHANATITPFNITQTAGVATTTPSFTGFPLGVTSGTFDQTYNMALPGSFNAAFITANGGTPASAETALASFIDTGRSYFNIHTSTFGGGEVRGFITAVPEPSSLALCGLIGLGVATRYWRKRKQVPA